MTYPHPRPTPPLQLYLLGGLALAGLLALWLAAFHAFRQVAGPAQASFAATLIEAGLVIEALLVMKYPRVWYVWIGPVISAAVSVTYNYLQASAQAPHLSAWPLLSLAIGPLSALLFVSLTLGHALAAHQAAVAEWQRDRAAWLERQATEAESYRRQQEEQRQARLDQMQAAERQRQTEAEAYRRQVEQEERHYQRRQAELAQRRAARPFTGRAPEARPFADRPPEAQAPAPALAARSPDADDRLTTVHQQTNGRSFRRAEVQQLAAVQKTAATELIRYGLQTGQLIQTERFTYAFAPPGNGHGGTDE